MSWKVGSYIVQIEITIPEEVITAVSSPKLTETGKVNLLISWVKNNCPQGSKGISIKDAAEIVNHIIGENTDD